MKSSVRIDNDEYEKENAADFVLWKAWKPTD
jgi:cysteinyl-tRNA synthetase